jgi:cell division protein FtsB
MRPFISRGDWVRTLGLGVCVIAILAVSALLDHDSGVGIWLELRGDLSASEARVARLVDQTESMRREIEMLEAEPAALDRAIREELDVALPGEIVVRFTRPERSGERVPVRTGWDRTLCRLFQCERKDRETR